MNAMRARGLSEDEAETEIARALIGCLWETNQGMPDRWAVVLRAVSEGQSTADLFPDQVFDLSGKARASAAAL